MWSDCGCSRILWSALYNVGKLLRQQEYEKSDVRHPRYQTIPASIFLESAAKRSQWTEVRSYQATLTHGIYGCPGPITQTFHKHQIPSDHLVRLRTAPLIRDVSHRKTSIPSDGYEKYCAHIAISCNSESRDGAKYTTNKSYEKNLCSFISSASSLEERSKPLSNRLSTKVSHSKRHSKYQSRLSQRSVRKCRRDPSTTKFDLL